MCCLHRLLGCQKDRKSETELGTTSYGRWITLENLQDLKAHLYGVDLRGAIMTQEQITALNLDAEERDIIVWEEKLVEHMPTIIAHWQRDFNIEISVAIIPLFVYYLVPKRYISGKS